MTEQTITGDRNGEPILSELDDVARQHRFEALQQRMQAVWDAWKLDLDDESVVVVPSVTMARTLTSGSAMTQAFEERFLFLLLLLRHLPQCGKGQYQHHRQHRCQHCHPLRLTQPLLPPSAPLAAPVGPLTTADHSTPTL